MLVTNAHKRPVAFAVNEGENSGFAVLEDEDDDGACWVVNRP